MSSLTSPGVGPWVPAASSRRAASTCPRLDDWGWVLKVAFASLFAPRQVVVLAAHQTQEELAVLKSLIESGKVKPVIEKRYSLAEVSTALSYQGQGHAQGKSVITVTG